MYARKTIEKRQSENIVLTKYVKSCSFNVAISFQFSITGQHVLNLVSRNAYRVNRGTIHMHHEKEASVVKFLAMRGTR